MKLITVTGRLKLLKELRERGFYVRWHAYEFLLGYRGRLIGALLLEPAAGKATLFCRECESDVSKMVREALNAVGEPLELSVVRLPSRGESA